MRSAIPTWPAVFLASLLVVCAPDTAQAEAVFEVLPKRFGVDDGLSHNAVHALLQDRHGFLWFGTQDGLDRFDGAELVHFRASAEGVEGLASGFITALAEDAGGALWIGTRRGLHRLDPAHQVLSRITLIEGLRQPP
ncbi:MAG TPA: two-component regulator propeller domain-containing protein, partial [Xanthomonadaceae bacterium]|nr:two-component regulator propeller domain-containing protein [Xanthomonadaceae bacterium]